MTPPDHELLESFQQRGSEPSFTELLNRHLGLVYSAALRITRQPSLAEEVSQNVFVKLARLQSPLKKELSLVVWLHQTTRSTAIDLLRAETRRRKREETAASLAAVSDTNAPWSNIAPVLDEVIERLSPDDRHVLLCRYFEGHSYSKLGRSLGLSEDATRMRVNRALERVRSLLQKRGITCSASALTLALPAQAITAVPPTLAATISASALAATATPLSLITIGIITMTKQTVTIVAACALLAAVGVSVYLTTRPEPPPTSTKPTPVFAGSGSSTSSGRAADSSTPAARPRAAAIEFDDLNQKYGAAEVRTARQIAVDFAVLCEEMKVVTESMNDQEEEGEGFESNEVLLGRAEDLKLTNIQEAKLKEIYDQHGDSIYEQFLNSSKTIRQNPRRLMEFFLASHARSQGAASEEEFLAASKIDGLIEEAMLSAILNRQSVNLDGFDPLLNEDFRRAFKSSLSADQIPVFDEIVSAKIEAYNQSKTPFLPKQLAESQQAVKAMGEVISHLRMLSEKLMTEPGKAR